MASTDLPGDWARDLAAKYRKYAEESIWMPRRVANFEMCARFEAIAARLDRTA